MRKLVVMVSCLASLSALSQGLQLDRYEPTPAGEGFTAVQAPWYGDGRLFAVGLGLDYGRDVVVGGSYDAQGQFRPTVGVISGQLAGHLDVAVAPFASWLFSASLPVNLHEQGTSAFGVTPISAPAIGDPRLGVDYRLFGDLARDPISFHLGGRLWIPVGAHGSHAGDAGVRGQLHAIAGGRPLEWLEWAANAGVYLRGHASLNQFTDGVGAAGPELRLAGGAAHVNDRQHYRVGAEVLFGTGLPGTENFRAGSNHLELLLSGAYTFADSIQVGPAIGFSPLRTDGTPSVRGILRITYVPSNGGRSAARVERQEPEQSGATPESATEGDETSTEPEPAEAATEGDETSTEPEPAEASTEGDETSTEPEPAEAAGEAESESARESAEPEPTAVADAAPSESEPESATTEPNEAALAQAAPSESEPAATESEPTAVAQTETRPSRPQHKPTTAASARPEFAFVAESPTLPAGCTHAPTFPEGTQLMVTVFAFDQTELGAGDHAALGRLAKALKAAPEARVAVAGFTDETGTSEYNLTLSRQRAEAVKAVLRSEGIASNRIEVFARGAASPRCPEPTEAHREQNRRAEVDLVIR